MCLFRRLFESTNSPLCWLRLSYVGVCCGYRARPFSDRSPRFALWFFPMAGGPCAILSFTCDNEDSARAAKLPEMGFIG